MTAIILNILTKIAEALVGDLFKDIVKEFSQHKKALLIVVVILALAVLTFIKLGQEPNLKPVEDSKPKDDFRQNEDLKKPPQNLPPRIPERPSTPNLPPSTPAPAPRPAQAPRVILNLDSALTPYKKDIESILSPIPLRNGISIDIAMSMETPETPDMPGAEPATISVIVDATATFKSSNGSPLKTMLLPRYKVTQLRNIIPNTDTYIRDRVKSAARGFAKSISEGL
jgi:hypothetical protein